MKAQALKGVRVPTPVDLRVSDTPKSDKGILQPWRCQGPEINLISSNHPVPRRTTEEINTNRSELRPAEGFRERTNLRPVSMAAPGKQRTVSRPDSRFR